MGVEHLQQLDIGGYDGNQIAPVTALQLSRTQPPQSPEHPVPDQRQQFEGNIVIASLFCISQNTPHKGKKAHANEHGRQNKRRFQAQHRQGRIPAENCDKCSAKMTNQPH